MNGDALLIQVLWFLAAALVAVPVTRALGIGSVLGYLVAGIAVGPPGFGLVTDVTGLLHFSEIGVVMLLFVIGLELHPRRLWLLRKAILARGGAQVVLTTAALAPFAGWLLEDWRAGLLVGFALSLSSTAFVLQTLAEQRRLGSPAGRGAFGVLLFQDLAIVPALALLPVLAGTEGNGAEIDWWMPIVAVLAVVAGGHFALRPLLRIIAGTGIHELFTAAALLLVMGSALLMQSVGLSAGLGAFLAGVLVADSEFRHQLETDILPFKGLLLGLFFMAVGMSVDPALLLDRPATVLAIAGGLMALKALVVWALVRISGLGHSVSLSMALMLAQGGEFAFVLFGQPAAASLLDPGVIDLLILAVILSMAATPVLFWIDGRLQRATDVTPDPEPDPAAEPDHQVVIAGFGRFGQVVGRLLSMAGIDFTAIEINATEVDFVRRYGHSVHYGDPRRLDVLNRARVDRARLFIIAVDDVEDSLAIARMVRDTWPRMRVIARVRNRRHAFHMRDLGIEVVSRDTLLSAVALGGDALAALGMDPERTRRTRELFLEHDARTLEEQYVLHREGDDLRQSARQAAADLRRLFEADARAAGRDPEPEDPAAELDVPESTPTEPVDRDR
ncbi:MAG: monovalent cation:proton antiporter-2 (CPA2) family protein [Gammaproteobacteria bacterium]|nr:monovalent cation:proton antiporter-2 (CPA2) family protein [Gammaproteobacteria bacterium]